MKTPSHKFLKKLGLEDPETNTPVAGTEKNPRREFFKKAGLGGMMLGGFLFAPIEDTLAQATSRVNRNSSPSDLKWR